MLVIRTMDNVYRVHRCDRNVPDVRATCVDNFAIMYVYGLVITPVVCS